jgi:RimJ/RimL family protein N-acetyltransferase
VRESNAAAVNLYEKHGFKPFRTRRDYYSDPVEDALVMVKEFCIGRDPKGAYAAVLKETDKVIGYVMFTSIDEPEIYEMGWIFNKDYWRSGYAFEACSRLVKYGFEDLVLHKICAEAIDSDKSVSLMKKLGMLLEGVQRNHAKANDGSWRDLHWYAILHEDYCRL